MFYHYDILNLRLINQFRTENCIISNVTLIETTYQHIETIAKFSILSIYDFYLKIYEQVTYDVVGNYYLLPNIITSTND